MKKTDRKKHKSLKPVSLKPLKFDEAVADILKVKPNPEDESKKESRMDRE